MGGASAICRHAGCNNGLFLVVSVIRWHRSSIYYHTKRHILGGQTMGKQVIKNHLIPFAIAFLVFALIFLGLDIGIMNLQGLSLIFES